MRIFLLLLLTGCSIGTPIYRVDTNQFNPIQAERIYRIKVTPAESMVLCGNPRGCLTKNGPVVMLIYINECYKAHEERHLLHGPEHSRSITLC